MKDAGGLHVAVIGAGWAGLAAAVKAVQAGAAVTLYEAARRPGGRARSVALPGASGGELQLDNGQHILIGAYRACLRLMESVGVDTDRSLRRMPLDLRDHAGHGLRMPAAAPAGQSITAAWAVLRACGWSWSMRLGLLRTLTGWRAQGFQAAPGQTVAGLCHSMPQTLVRQFVEPLCAAALNTPIETASAAVFLRVLRDSLSGGPGSSDLLLPAVPLGELLAGPACAWLQARGASVWQGTRVQTLARCDTPGKAGWLVDGRCYDAVLLATPAAEAARLLSQLQTGAATAGGPDAALEHWQALAAALPYEAIGTVYLRSAGQREALPWGRPMLAVPGGPAQFAFDRASLCGEPGVSAWVASALRLGKADLEQQVLAQARALYGGGGLQKFAGIVEKRATFACIAGLKRPAMLPHECLAGLAVAGDYVEGPYPATLEGAVQSGEAAMALLLGP